MSERGESKRTTDHDEIRDRVEEHGGQPSRVEGTGNGGGLLRIDFDDGDSRFTKLVSRDE